MNDRNLIFFDIHAAGGGKNDWFRRFSERAFINCVRMNCGSTEELIFGGDAADIREDSYRDILRAHPDVGKWLEDAQANGRWVYGNHDPDMYLVDYLDLGERIRVIHGHIFDRWNSGRLKWVGDFLSVVNGWIERCGIRLNGLRKLRSMRWQKKARRYMKENGLEILIFGHTHDAGDFDLGEGLRAVNGGTWNSAGNWYYVERLGRQVRLVPWDESSLAERLGRIFNTKPQPGVNSAGYVHVQEGASFSQKN